MTETKPIQKKTATAVSFTLIITTVMLLLCSFAVRAVDVSAHSAILIEADSGDVIFEKNAHVRLPMASTTKIMTALIALENGDIHKKVKVSADACGIEGSSIYLSEGEELTLEDLLYGIMLESANDAAAAVAYEIAGSIEEFSVLMNKKAAELGLSDTHFTNPHGLDNDEHYTTASDLAQLTAYAMQNNVFRKIVSTYKYQIPMSSDGTRHLLNHNKLLRLSDDVVGVKTGYTKRSGRCLVSCAERDGVSVIAVTLNASDDWNDHLAMHELGFSTYHSQTLAYEGQFTVEIPCVGVENGFIRASNRDGYSLCLKNGVEVSHRIEADQLLFPPIYTGDILGYVVFNLGMDEIARLPLYAESSVYIQNDKPPLHRRILEHFD